LHLRIICKHWKKLIEDRIKEIKIKFNSEKFDDVSLRGISNCKNLTYLNLNHCEKLTFHSLKFLENLENLTYLSIPPNFNADSFKHIINIKKLVNFFGFQNFFGFSIFNFKF
jgi:Leucine-rich repeat (LRR) protein